jgi:hypothetical protein
MIKTNNRNTKVLKAIAKTLGYMIGGTTILFAWAYLLINYAWIAGAIIGALIARAVFKEVMEGSL